MYFLRKKALSDSTTSIYSDGGDNQIKMKSERL